LLFSRSAAAFQEGFFFFVLLIGEKILSPRGACSVVV